MIYTAPCVMFLMCADPLRGQVGGGWSLEIKSLLGLMKWHRADRRGHLGPKRLQISWRNPLPLAQVMDLHTSKIIMYRDV